MHPTERYIAWECFEWPRYNLAAEFIMSEYFVNVSEDFQSSLP